MSSRITILTVLWAVLAIFATPMVLAQSTDTRTSRSISFTASVAPDKTTRDDQLKQTDSDVMAALQTSGYRPESGPVALRITSASYANDYSIYDASTTLISDLDGDGFYHRISVNIDADTVYATALVYARLYLSFEGGPWNLYATSDAYYINGDSSLDGFTVETELAEGYAPGYYDVRIELYDAELNQWLVSAGPYDAPSLSALPLEDSYLDDAIGVITYPGQAEVMVAATGSLGHWWLVLPGFPLVARRFTWRGFGAS